MLYVSQDNSVYLATFSSFLPNGCTYRRCDMGSWD